MSIGSDIPQETPESVESGGYDDAKCPYCDSANIESDYLYDDDERFLRIQCKECGNRWYEDGESEIEW